MTEKLFTKAVKYGAKIRFAISGPSGSGKTYTALRMAKVLAEGGNVAVIDSEHGSSAKYADEFGFDICEVTPPHHPDRYVAAMQAAVAEGYSVLVVDTLSHAWFGEGGLLELVDQFAHAYKTKDSFRAWKDATPIQTRMVEAILGLPVHT